jgi:hypothetical protein
MPAMFFRDTYLEMGYLAFPLTAFTILFSAKVFTWPYISTGGSLLLVVLFHAFFNLHSVSEAGGQFVAPLMSFPVILLALYAHAVMDSRM